MRNEFVQRVVREGRNLRQQVKRGDHSSWAVHPARPDPNDVLQKSNQGRIPALIPVRHARMRESLFTYLRGFPSMMAYDLAHAGLATQIQVQICGDAHLENFGIFATAERNVIFDINDFDETTVGPWEWDVKRLGVSAYVAAKVNGFSSGECERVVEAALGAYRSRMWLCTEQTMLAVWYLRTDASELLRDISSLDKKEAPKNAPEDTHELVCEEYTTGEGIGERLADRPPKLFHGPKHNEVLTCTREALQTYPNSLRDDVRTLFQCYEIADVAVKVVGIGSVATRCGVALLKAHEDDGLVLQAKEARPSVYAPFVPAPQFANQGQRIISGQRLMQFASDLFLGWGRSKNGHDFFIRQIADMKASIDVSTLNFKGLRRYAALCGDVLAVGHARSGSAAMIAGYLGRSNRFDAAVLSFVAAYTQQLQQDYERFLDGIESGDIPADRELRYAS